MSKPLEERCSPEEWNKISFLLSTAHEARLFADAYDKQKKEAERDELDAKARLIFLFHCVEPGVLVKVLLTGSFYKVNRVSIAMRDPDPQNPPMLYGFKQKKDGKFGIRECAVWRKWKLAK